MSTRILDMFCGAGGSSAGARMAGAEIVAGIDAWDVAARTYADNFGEDKSWLRRLGPNSRPFKDLLEGSVDLLLASPECTNHSPAKGAKPRSEESRGTAHYVLNYARHLMPRWIVIENVIQMGRWSGYPKLTEGLVSAGYRIRAQKLDAADFGVPQTRRRLYLVCDRDDDPPHVKPPSKRRVHVEEIINFEGKWPSKPLYGKRAAATIARAERAIAALGRGVPFLIVYYGSDGAGGWQSLNRPIRTLTTLDRFGLVTWDGREPMLRMLQVDELKRAMGFPKSHSLGWGTRRERIMLLGNGVCPPVMKAIVGQLAE